MTSISGLCPLMKTHLRNRGGGMEWINTLTFLLLSYQLLPKAKSALEVLPKYSLMDVYLE